MKKSKLNKLIVVGMCICALTGCGSKPDVTPNTSQPTNTNQQDTNDTSENGGTDLLGSATMSGSVFEFTDSGCSISQNQEIDGGNGLKKEDEGHRNKDNAVSINYNADCEFVIATLNKQSGTITNTTSGSISDVKKESDVYIYGELVDTHNLNANKIVIIRWE